MEMHIFKSFPQCQSILALQIPKTTAYIVCNSQLFEQFHRLSSKPKDRCRIKFCKLYLDYDLNVLQNLHEPDKPISLCRYTAVRSRHLQRFHMCKVQYNLQGDELKTSQISYRTYREQRNVAPSCKTCTCITRVISADNEWNPSPAVKNSSLGG